MMGLVEEMPVSIDPSEVIDEFEAMTKDAERVQRETLKRILDLNSGTEYLQKWDLGGNTDPETFKACVPVTTHEDLEPYIQRIVDGDKSPILAAKPFKAVSVSSGTSRGMPKFVPFNEELVEISMQIFKTSYAFRNREFPIGKGKSLQFIYGSKQFKTKGGLDAGTATTNFFKNPLFNKKMKAMLTPICSPEEVIFAPDFNQALYCHLLCGLLFREEVQFVSSTFAYSLVQAFRSFEELYEDLCTDIRTGVLSSRITVPSIRTAVSRSLHQPNPELADLVYNKCRGLNNFYGLIPELFPNARYIYGVMTGSMEPYVSKLRHYAGVVPLVSADYGASEGWIGVNVNPSLPPERVTFTPIPDIAYFEFIPREQADSKPVGLTEVKLGEEYEVIITSFSGLYRYKLGDVVKVLGFHNCTPELQYICRSNVLLNITTEKITDKDLQLSVEKAAKILAGKKLEVLDFTSAVDSSSEPAHYVIFWEMSGEASDEMLQECCNCLDLSFVDVAYTKARKSEFTGALEIRVLKRGAFHKILEHFVGLGAAVSQFKTPRCVSASNSSVLQILHDNAVKSYFSTAY